MAAIRLISDEILTFVPNPGKENFQKQKGYIIPSPQGKSVIVAFISHLHDGPRMPSIIHSAIKNDLGVVYVCDKMPEDPVIDPHIHYLETPDKWFIHTLFMNPLQFASVYATRSANKLAEAFSSFTKYFIPIIRKDRDLSRLSDNYEKNKDNILVEVFGGVGDHLLTIPSLKTLAERGNNVYVLCDEHRNPCYHNLPYIKGFYSRRNEVDISRFKKVIYLNFGQLLNDYRQDFNKQNRIYSVAELCGLRPEDLVIDRPEIILTKDEQNNAQRKWAPYQKKIFLGYDSARVDSKLPSDITQEVINKLKARGYTVFVTSNRRRSYTNCIDLNKKLELREMFALVSLMDCVVSVDTSFLHVAGAFNKTTFCLMNYFKPEWRCSTYKNCTTYTPNVSCFPCVAKQFVCSKEWKCHDKSCYTYHNWDQVYKDVDEFFRLRAQKESERIKVSESEYIPAPPEKICEEDLPAKVVKIKPDPSKKIAAFWMGGMGDAVMLGYLCRAMKRKYPGCQIDAFVRDISQVQAFIFDYPDIRAQYSRLSWKKTFDSIKDYYDVIYEFRPYPYVWYNYDKSLQRELDEELYNNWQKSTGHILENWNGQTFQYYAHKTDLELTAEDLKIPLIDKPDVETVLKNKYNLPDKYITVSSGCDQNVGVLKLWPNEKWEELIELLKKKGYEIIQLGNEKDTDLSGARKIKCENLIDLMYVLKQSDLHVSNEGGLVHLAHAVGIKSVVLFGPTTPTLYSYRDNINIYHGDCPSCWWRVHGWSSKCKEGHKTCVNIDKISVHQVYCNILKGLKNESLCHWIR
jgi:ADP-heptose:LPS heptosyltransferase